MSYFPEMEWCSKWDWENPDAYGSKAMESVKKLQLAGWMLVDDGEIETGSFNLSGSGNMSGASGSDGGNGSSGKSSVSASTDSCNMDGMQTPKFSFMGFKGSTLNFSKNIRMKGSEVSGTSPPLEASVGSFEPVIGLKLGKRTYFENNGNVKNASLSVMPTPTVMQKKTKSSGKIANIPRCQVEGCNIDLSMFKEYHQKHRVCDSHSKCPKVIIGGHERRFCQQCSRFHSLAEFDEKKRSCRRRLSDHNARRRKPPQESIQFNLSRLSSPLYGGRHQLSFLLNNSPLTYSAIPASSTWDNACNSKFTLTKDFPFKSSNSGGTDKQLNMSGVKFEHVTRMHNDPVNGLLPSKSFETEVLSPGTKGSLMISSHLDAAPAYRRALSLLSNNSWASCEPESAPAQSHSMHEKDIYTTQPMINSIPEGVTLSCSDLWPIGQHLNHPRIQSLPMNSNFQEVQLVDMPYGSDFYSNILN